MKILFVCTGNTCRSAMCEGLFKKLAENDRNITVSSAGVSAADSAKASLKAVQALNEMGIDISDHLSKQITAEDVNDADLIITMTPIHKLIILNSCPEARDKVFTIHEYSGLKGSQVTDPYGSEIETYRKCAKELNKLVKAVYEKVKNDKKIL